MSTIVDLSYAKAVERENWEVHKYFVDLKNGKIKRDGGDELEMYLTVIASAKRAASGSDEELLYTEESTKAMFEAAIAWFVSVEDTNSATHLDKGLSWFKGLIKDIK